MVKAPIVSAYTATCSYCGATPDNWCLTLLGRRRLRPHVIRYVDARRAYHARQLSTERNQ